MVHEFTTAGFKTGVPHAEQEATMEQIGELLTACNGFVSREYFYSASDELWLSHVTWETEADLEASQAVDSGEVARLFERIEPVGTLHGRYSRRGKMVALSCD